MLAIVWLRFGPATADLAAQAHRVRAFAADGFAIWDNSWYAGHHVPGYSLVFPALGSVLGARPTGALAAIASALLFDRLVGRRSPAAARWWFAAGCCGDLLVGRLTYALGLAIGIAAITALCRDRPWLAVALGTLCAAASPVAGLFLALAGVAVAVVQRRSAAALVAAAALAVVILLSAAFPEGGDQPFSTSSFLVTMSIVAAAAAVVGPRPALRWPLALYAVAVALCYVVPTPMGGNVTRLGTAFVVPALLAVRFRPGNGPRAALILVLATAVVWQWLDPLTQAARGWRDPSAVPQYYAPLLSRLHGDTRTFRVEVPFTRGHWETAYLARSLALARGWERQLDRRLNPLFYRAVLSPASYHGWLRDNAVRYVALPDVPLDPAGAQEGAVIAQRPWFLRQVWSGAHWRLFRVLDAAPLASAPADEARIADTTVHIHVSRPGAVLVRVHWTPYWRLEQGAGCLYQQRDWTGLRALRAGSFVLRPRFSADRFFEDLPACPAPQLARR